MKLLFAVGFSRLLQLSWFPRQKRNKKLITAVQQAAEAMLVLTERETNISCLFQEAAAAKLALMLEMEGETNISCSGSCSS